MYAISIMAEQEGVYRHPENPLHTIVAKRSPSGEMRGMAYEVDPFRFTLRFNRWKQGMFIQDAFPQLTDDEREFILTGLTPEDWDAIFPEE